MSAVSETERNKAVIRRFVEEVQNKKDFGVYDELNDPDFVKPELPSRAFRPTVRAERSF